MTQAAYVGMPSRRAARSAQESGIFVGSLQWEHDPSLDIAHLLRAAHIRDWHPSINPSNFYAGRGPAHTLCGKLVMSALESERVEVGEIEVRLNGNSQEAPLRCVTLQQALSCMATIEHIPKAHPRSPILVLGSPIQQGSRTFGQMIELMASGLAVGVIDITGGVEVVEKRILMARSA